MDNKINIAFADWWPDFVIQKNLITKALDGKIEYSIVSDPQSADFVFCSVFGHDYLNYSCPRIVYTPENITPDFNRYDYGIGFDFLDFGDRYFRYPLYAAYKEADCKKLQNAPPSFEAATQRDFCCRVVSNGGIADPMRDTIFDALCRYKNVASGGRYRNNIGKPEGVPDKGEFVSKFKFNLACENSSYPGYCTEKLLQAFAYGTVPIYWGDPDAGRYFNPKAFINANSFSSVEELVDYVKKVDEDDELYYRMLTEEKIIKEEFKIEYMQEQFSKWLCKVVSQKKENAFRHAHYGRNMLMELEERSNIPRLQALKKKEQTKIYRLSARLKTKIYQRSTKMEKYKLYKFLIQIKRRIFNR